jgi:hypothetical protein
LVADFLVVFLGILESGSIRNAKSGMLREIGKGGMLVVKGQL